jgi:hypothetical protein
VLYVAIVLAGAFIIVALGLQNQSPGIPDVNAQSNNYGSLVSRLTPTAYTFPGDVMFSGASFPGDIMRDSSGGMRTIMTCNGCTQTMSTCDWQCGPTFSQCGTRVGQGSTLGLLGETYTSGICTGTENITMPTCSNSLFGCGGGTMSTCGSSLFGCGGGTMSTCSNSLFERCGGGTMSTCSNSLFGGCVGGTMSTCFSSCGLTRSTCSGSLFGSCGGTMSTCSGSLFGVCGGNTLGVCSVLPTSAIGCIREPEKTSNNCPIIDGQTSWFCRPQTMGFASCDPSPIPTMGIAACDPSPTRGFALCEIRIPDFEPTSPAAY